MKLTIVDIISIILLIIILGYSLIKKYINDKNGNKSNEHEIDNFCIKHYKKIWIIFAIILFFTVIYKFGNLPNYLGCDEAGMAYDAYCLSEFGTDRYMNSYPLYLTNFGQGQSVLCAYLAVLCIKLFGNNMLSYRLPMLIIYILSVIASYLMVSKYKGKKLALLFTFLIITLPWYTLSVRFALDCNLYSGMFMISLYFMTNAKKNYQFFISGILLGLTLYTYCLSWISIPTFLIAWIIYMIYIKRINFKQIVIMGIPILIFAFPLIYFLLLNFGIVHETNLGIFSLPILGTFRSDEIDILNIFKTGLSSLKVIFLNNEISYLIYFPLFIIGYVISFKNMIRSIKIREYDFTVMIVITFSSLLLGLLCANIPTVNKANVLFMLELYFIAIAISKICYNSYFLKFSILALILVLFINYEIHYYKYKCYETNYYEDQYLYPLVKELEENENYKNIDKYVISNKATPYIYVLLGLEMSPNEHMNTLELTTYANNTNTTKVGNYHFIYYYDELKEVLDKNAIFIVSDSYQFIIDEILSRGYIEFDYGDYTILKEPQK